MKHPAQCLLSLTCVVSLIFSISSCGSGGGEGASSPVSTTTQTIVSGTVQAPGGQVAFFKRKSFGDHFVSEAYAALTGLANVPDNTIVQLARLDANASSFSVISTTSTSGGRYSFNLTALGLQPANDLIVRVAGSGGKEMRAFVVGTIVDISPVSEAAYQIAIQSLNGTPLGNFTLQEVSDISGAVGLTATLQNLGAATSIDQAVDLVKTAVRTNAQLTGFLTAATANGQTTQGTGDIGNFFPFEQNNFWRYHGTSSTNTSYETNVLISGQGLAPNSGVTSTIVSETNANGANRAEKSYHVKGVTGITSYGNDDPNDDVSRQLAPYQAVHFPLTAGTTTVLAERTGLDWGNDEDGDGANETYNLHLSQTILGMESITVPAGTFPNSLRMESKAVFLVSFTRGGSGTASQTNTTWLVPGVGRVKETVKAQVEGGPAIASLTEQLLSYVVNGKGSGARIELSDGNLGPGAPLNMRLENTRQLFGAVYDQANRLIPGVPLAFSSSNPQVASVDAQGLVTALSPGQTTITAQLGNIISNAVSITVNDVRVLSLSTNDIVYDPVSRKLYASVPNNSGPLSNTITIIDPESGSIGRSLKVGLDPSKLGISDNGEYLYVGLNGEGAIQRVTLPTFTAGPKFVLHTLPDQTCAVWTAGEIRVQPGNPLVVAVLKRRCGNSEGVEIYENGIRRPNAVPARLNGIAFSKSPGVLFGIEAGPFGHVYRLAVSSAGVSIAAASPEFQEPFGTQLEFDSGRLYSTSAQVIDATTLNEIGRFQDLDLVHGGLVAPDIGRNRVFMIPNAYDPKILGFDATTLQRVGSIPILHNLDSATFGLFEGSLIKWGANGLAFRAGNDPLFGGLGVGDKIVLVRTSAIP